MEQNSTAPTPDTPLDPLDSVWRDQVQARVAGYRSRRGRRIEGAFSMRFPFPPAEPVTRDSDAEPACQRDTEAACLVEDADSAGAQPALITSPAIDVIENPAVRTEPPEDTQSQATEGDDAPDYQEPQKLEAPRSRRKVIAFPRPVTDPSYRPDDLLLPERPRILDAGEEFPSFPATPLLDGLVFPSQESQAAAAATARDHVELPLQAAAIGQRLYAGLVDCTLVAVAAGVFVAAGYRLLPKPPSGKPLLLACAAIAVLLWAVYQYIFLVYGGRTAGMHRAGIQLSTFRGGFPTRRQRRNRVIALHFATASLMMGILWALVDVDALCWHDRISRTYLTKDSS